MGSGAVKVHQGSFTGAAAVITVATCPFQPRTIKFWATGGVWGVKVADQVGMDGDNYLSNSAADAGVTITASGFTVASGADVNVSGQTVYYECAD